MTALFLARAEMGSIFAKFKISAALRSKPPPATKYVLPSGDNVRIYKENANRWCGPVKIIRSDGKQVTVSDGKS